MIGSPEKGETRREKALLNPNLEGQIRERKTFSHLNLVINHATKKKKHLPAFLGVQRGGKGRKEKKG